jgi:hypothetical protein
MHSYDRFTALLRVGAYGASWEVLSITGWDRRREEVCVAGIFHFSSTDYKSTFMCLMHDKDGRLGHDWRCGYALPDRHRTKRNVQGD